MFKATIFNTVTFDKSNTLFIISTMPLPLVELLYDFELYLQLSDLFFKGHATIQ